MMDANFKQIRFNIDWKPEAPFTNPQLPFHSSN